MAVYTLPEQTTSAPSAPVTEISGEDVMFRDGMEIGAGDWRTVRGADAAEQSVRREALSTVGGLMRRPEWGMGVTQTVFRSSTRSLTDALTTRVRKRMLANPRVGRFIDAQVVRVGSRLSLHISYEPVGVKRSTSVILKGGR